MKSSQIHAPNSTDKQTPASASVQIRDTYSGNIQVTGPPLKLFRRIQHQPIFHILKENSVYGFVGLKSQPQKWKYVGSFGEIMSNLDADRCVWCEQTNTLTPFKDIHWIRWKILKNKYRGTYGSP